MRKERFYTTYEQTEYTPNGESLTMTEAGWREYYERHAMEADFVDFEDFLTSNIAVGNLIEEEPPAFRVDSFPGIHERFFDNEQDAVDFGKSEVAKGRVAFLLEHALDGVYSVEREIR